MARVKKVLLEEQAARREKALREEVEEQDRERDRGRMMVEVNEPQAAWGGGGGGMARQGGYEYVGPGWGAPGQPPPRQGRAF